LQCVIIRKYNRKYMKTILLVEHENPKIFPLEYAKKHGYRIIIVTNHFSNSFLNFITKDDIIITDIFNTATVIEDVLYYIKLNNIHIDAVGTFREDLVVIAGDLSSCLNCKGAGQLSSRKTSNNKLLMRESLSKNLKINQPKYTVFNIFDENSYSNITIPSVVKPIFGTASHGVLLIKNRSDIISLKNNILSTVNSNCRESFSRFKGNMLCEEYIKGKLISVDGFVSDGIISIVGSIEFIMGKEPYFTQISSYIPSRSSKMEIESCNIMLSHIISQLGLRNTAFHAEFKIKDGNPFLIEIGARLPGASIHETYNKIYQINMIELMFKCWLGESIPRYFNPKGINYHTLVYPKIKYPGILTKLSGINEIIKDSDIWYTRQIAKIGDKITVYPDIPSPLLEYSCFSKSLISLESKKDKIISLIRYTITNN
jgi:hypothetical protein